MLRVPSPEFNRIVLDAISEKYKLALPREGIHLSTLVYCLTKSFLDTQAPPEPSDIEIMLFATGYGLQDVMTPKLASTPTIEKDSIIYRPDFLLDDRLCEIKTTRAGAKRYTKGDYPQTWIEYIMGGCYITGKDTYYLSVLYISERPVPVIQSEVLTFEHEELLTNWGRLTERMGIYKVALVTNVPPTPFTYNKKWECDNCRHHTLCDTIVILESRARAKKDIEKYWPR